MYMGDGIGCLKNFDFSMDFNYIHVVFTILRYRMIKSFGINRELALQTAYQPKGPVV